MEIGRWGPRDPRTAARYVTLTAVAFTLLWLGAMVYLGATLSEGLKLWGMILVVTPLNAYAVTYVLWRRCAPAKSRLTYRRAGAIGIGIGVLSYFTYALALNAVWLVLAPSYHTTFTAPLFFWGSIYLTGGIPVLLTLGVALVLARREKRSVTPT